MRVSVGVNTSSHKSHLEPIFDLPNEQTTLSTFGMARLATVALSKISKVFARSTSSRSVDVVHWVATFVCGLDCQAGNKLLPL
jgi:hypothetical protein